MKKILTAVVAVAIAAGCNKGELPSTTYDHFLSNLTAVCNQSFAGTVTANEPDIGDDPFHGQKLVMHVRECSDSQVKIPFHVGDDHSRTWVVTRTADGLQLKHDHRHFDGVEDALSMYGGETKDSGSAKRQEFPVDSFSMDLFQKEGINASTTNVWAMEIEPGRYFRYELFRPDGRLFRVEFDLTKTVETPPAPWGYPELPAKK